MNHADLEKCLSFINCHLSSRKPFDALDPRLYRTVTISRQAGSGGHRIAELLAQQLKTGGFGGQPWTIFDRNLVEKVLEDHQLPARIARFMPEDRVSQVSDIMDDLFGLHPPSWVLVRKTFETILHLAELGNVILIGRGANLITSRLAHVFHVRLVGSIEKRANRLEEANSVTLKDALKQARSDDLARQRYVRQFFSKDIDDPLLYHLVLNTDMISADNAARLIASAMSPHGLALAA